MITKKQLKQIKSEAIHLDWDVAFEGKSKGNKHLFRVVEIAKILVNKQNARRDICEAGAWLHDIGLIRSVRRNDKGIDLADKFLRKIGVSLEDRKAVLHCIKCHDGFFKTKTLEAKIVHDADTLDKMGALGVLRETWKKAQAGWNTERIARHLKHHLEKRERRLHLPIARRMARRMNLRLKEFFNLLDDQLAKQRDN